MPIMSAETLIAVVEDDPEIRALVSGLLSREGFVIEACANGVELNRALQRRRVDLVVLDIMMPGEDGLSICRRLRTRRAAGPNGVGQGGRYRPCYRA